MNTRHPQDKNKTGPVRGEAPQPGRWYEDRAEGRQISSRFTAASGMVPSNPVNYRSAMPQASAFAYDTIAEGLATYVSPYGDGRTFMRPEEPVLTTPGPAAQLIAAADLAKGAAEQVRTPGYGFGAGSRLAQIDAAQQQTPVAPATSSAPAPLGMSTSMSLGGGPQRNVPKPA